MQERVLLAALQPKSGNLSKAGTAPKADFWYEQVGPGSVGQSLRKMIEA